MNQKTKYGGGLTFTSIHYDIFKYAQVRFFKPPPGFVDCTKFSYSAFADIQINNPNYSENFVEKYNLQPVLAYAMSENTGKLIAYKAENTVLPATQNNCISLETIGTIHQQSPGKQRVELSIQIPTQIVFDGARKTGFDKMKFIVTYSGAVTGIDFSNPDCRVITPASPPFECAFSNQSNNGFEI